MSIYERTIDSIISQKKRNIEGQFSLFDDVISQDLNMTSKEEIPNIAEYNEKALLTMEKEMVGVYLSGHPLSEYEKELEKITTTNTSEIMELKDSHENNAKVQDGSRIVIGGIIVKKQNKITKNNNMMAFITLEDLYGAVEGIVFPKIYENCKDALYEDNIVVVEGLIDASEEEEPKIICNKITELKKEDNTEVKKQRKLYLKVDNTEAYKKIKNELFKNICKYPGSDCVIIYNSREKANMVLPVRNWVNIDNEKLINDLKVLLGEKNIAIR